MKLTPTVEEIRKLKEESGMGLVECKRQLLKANIEQSIEQCFTMNDVRAILRVVVTLL